MWSPITKAALAQRAELVEALAELDDELMGIYLETEGDVAQLPQQLLLPSMAILLYPLQKFRRRGK